MSEPARPLDGVSPVIFDMPTLGHNVYLGELYDQRSGKFLGVQLYPQKEIQETVTAIDRTELSLALYTTREQKASLLGVDAHLSLQVLSGLVKVSGSARYLNDEKSNTHEYAYALALKRQLCEKRLLFAEEELSYKALRLAHTDYVATNLATHLVSSIVYGGNYIVNLVARQSEFSKEENVVGRLQAQLDTLKGAISLEGSVDTEIRQEFDSMNDKFDLVVHGDVDLKTAPVNLRDVLDTFPKADASLSARPVPISVTLHPIPPHLHKGSPVYPLDTDFVDDVLRAFSILDDLASRFLVLEDRTKSLEGFIPELSRAARAVAAAHSQEHRKLLKALGAFLLEYQHGKAPCLDSIFAHTESGRPFGITGDKVLKKATELHGKHLDPDQKDANISSQYPSSLAGLENELLRFRDFVATLKRVEMSLRGSTRLGATGTVKSIFSLSNVKAILDATTIQRKIPVFVMIPLTGDRSNADLTVLKYIAILRKHAAYFADSANPAYMFYAENLNDLERRLPNGGKFSELRAPSLFVGEVDDDGNLTWVSVVSPPAPVPSDLTPPLDHKSAWDFIGPSGGSGRRAVRS